MASFLTNDTLFSTYIQIKDSLSSNKTILQSASIPSDLTFTLPINYGSNNQVLSTNGSGTLAWIDNGVISISGTTNRITVTGTSNAVIDIAATYVGQTSITTLGTITSGTWNGSIIGGTYGGTGVNNGSSTITIAGNLSTASALSIGTAATVNQLFYTSATNTLSGLTNQINSGLLTNGSGNISWVTVTGTGAPVLANSPILITPNIGVANGTSLSLTSTTAATSSSTGSITTAGGIGIGKNIWVGAAFTATNTTTDGSVINIPSFTYTCSTSNPSNVNVSSIGSVTINSSSTSTITSAASHYINGPPIAGTSTTITNPLALQVASGNLGLGGNMGIAGYINNIKLTSGLGSNTNIQYSSENISVPFTIVNSAFLGSGGVGIGQGYSVSMYGDTFVTGSPNDNSSVGAVWVFVKSWTNNGNVTWTQQGSKLIGTGAVGNAKQGVSVSIYKDTLVVGGNADNSNTGAVWVYTRTNGVWTQQGSKLVGTGSGGGSHQGYSVSIYEDTLVVGGFGDSSNTGAVWVYTRSNGVWTQQGSKLVGTGAVGNARQGISVSIYQNTLVSGGYYDNSNTGAVWVFTRSNGVWTQQGSKLVGTGASGAANQGTFVSLFKDTLALCGLSEPSVWIFVRSGTNWTQQGSKLLNAGLAVSVYENTLACSNREFNTGSGVAYVYTRSGTTWTLQTQFNTASGRFGYSIALGSESDMVIGQYAPGAGQNLFTYSRVNNDTLTSNPNLQWNSDSLNIYGNISNTQNIASLGNISTNANINNVNSVNSIGNNFNVLYTERSSSSTFTQQQTSTLTVLSETMVSKGLSCSMYNDSTLVFTSSLGVWIFIKTYDSIGNIVYSQQGTKFQGTGATNGLYTTSSIFENTVLFSDYTDNTNTGASWVYFRSGSTWTEQTGTKLVGTGATGAAQQGFSNSLYGNTLIVGGPADNTNAGAAWIFVRSGSTWTQQGSKLVGTGATGAARQGASVSIYENTVAIGGTDDNSSVGATWIFVRNGTTWYQQGLKLVGTGNTGASQQGYSVSLFEDTLAVAGYGDNLNAGATWIFVRNGTTWTQQGSKLVGTGATGAAQQGRSISLNTDTLVVLGPADNSNVGAIWVFKRSGTTWTQQGTKIVVSGSTATTIYNTVKLGTEGNFALSAGSLGQTGNVFTFWENTPNNVVSSPNFQWTNTSSTLNIYGTITYSGSPFLTYRGILNQVYLLAISGTYYNLTSSVSPCLGDPSIFTPSYGGSGSPFPDFSNGGIRISVNGLYFFTMTFQFDDNSLGGSRYIYITLNNTSISTDGSIIKVAQMNGANAGTRLYVSCEFVYFLRASDLITVFARQTSTSAMNLTNDQNANVGFSIVKIG